jgi:hypothetical protein
MENEDGADWRQQQELEERRMFEEKEENLRLDEAAARHADRYANRGSTVWYNIYEAFAAGAEFGRKTVKSCGCGEVKINYSQKCNS